MGIMDGTISEYHWACRDRGGLVAYNLRCRTGGVARGRKSNLAGIISASGTVLGSDSWHDGDET